jgi:branched-chain amino acid aminotransferase
MTSSFDYTVGQAFLRDSFVPFKDANVSIASSPVLYGLSVYTVFSVNWNEAEKKRYAFRLKDHYRRLVNSAAIMDMNKFAAAWPYERFEATMKELIAGNAGAIAAEDALVRVTVFVDALIAGTKIHDLPQSLSAYVYPMGQILPRAGVNMCVSSWTHGFDNVIPSRAKVNGGYANNSLIKNEAILNGYDDAIVLDVSGRVTEATVANIFIVRNGALITPGVSVDILEGITRASVLAIARDAGVPIEERAVDRTELYIADEAFISGSSARLVPIMSVDKRPVGAAAAAAAGSGNVTVPGPITKVLSEKYEAAQRGTDGGVHAAWRMEI